MDTEVILASVEAIVSDSTQAKQETATEKSSLWQMMCKEVIDDDTPPMLFIYVLYVLYGYASGIHLFIMLI